MNLLPQVLVARRGTPTPSYRAGPVDYKTLPKVELPALKALPANQLAMTPPMGWNSWNKFRTKIDDQAVRGIADALVESGMRDAGYIYVNIDDGWQGKRDSNGVLQPNPNFPDMKALADYVHSKGLKLGIYSSPGPRSCGGYEGSYGHEEIDARTWASWGIDYLKYDWCSASQVWKDEDMRAVYQRMGEAIRATGRPMVYSLCQYGRARVESWGPLVGGNLWRTTFDIFDNWSTMLQNVSAQEALAPSATPGHWNDPDMLEVGNGGMTTTEYRAHFSLWAMVAAPIIAGNDVRSMDAATREILLNKEVIAVNQDRLGQQGRRVAQQGDIDIWLRKLSNGAHALAIVNRGNAEAEVTTKWADLDLPAGLHARDLWMHRDLGRLADAYRGRVSAHGVVLLRLNPSS
jgi:alpha-galactosidase